MYPVLSSSRRGPLFPPLPEDPVSDSSLHESEIISHDSSSSDDDTEKTAKRRRMLKHAESYLRGEPLYLHSARLRGPVVKNPWGKKTVGQVKRKDGKGEGDGGIRKKLKRYNISEEDGREVPSTLTQAKKNKRILTSRGTNTIDDVLPDPSTPRLLRTRYPTAANVPDRSLSCSPVSRIKSVRNRTLELDKHDSPFNLPKQTDDEFTIAVYKTPGKKRPERGPVEVLPVCSPTTFYSRPKPPQTISSSLREAQGSSSKSKTSTSAQKPSTQKTSSRKNTKEQEVISDVIVVASPIPPPPDAETKKKRPKIDFAAKLPFVGAAPERAKQSKGRKKKITSGQENVPEAEKQRPGHILGSISLAALEKDVERVGDTSQDAATEKVLNDWLCRHVAASQDVRLRNGASSGASVINPPLDPAREFSSATSAQTATAPAPISDNLAITAETVETAGVPTMPLKVPLRPTSMVIPQDTLQTLPLPETMAIQSPQPENEKTNAPLSPNSDGNTVSHSPTLYSQQPKAHSQIQPGSAEPEPPIPGAEEPLQSQAASWQNTQYQLLAAQKGFFDALQDSPVVFSPHLNETPGRDLLRPISYFDNEPGVSETPQPGNDRTTDENMSPSKYLTDRNANFQSIGGRDAFISPFRSTFGEGGESPLGTAFTPFRAFATPESSPKQAGERHFSPLTFTPEAPAQIFNGSTSTTRKSVKFGFGLLDDDDDEEESTSRSFGSGFSPVNFRDPGQQGAVQAEDLVEQVMGFMGGGVWDIDDELKKMAGGSALGETASTSRAGEEGNGKGKGSSARKKRLYGKRH